MEQDKQEIGQASASPNPGKRRTRWLIAGGVAVLALAGIGAAGAMGGGMGPHMMAMGMGGGPFGGHGIERALDAVDATAEQEDRIWAIIDGARTDLRPTMREFRDTRKQVMELMTAPTIDTAAVEKLRADRVAEIDTASKKITAAAIEAAQVLSPEQRAKLAEQMKERKGFGRW